MDVIIDSPGGQMDSAFKATLVFQSYCEDYVAIIPRYAKSGATLFSLGGSEILMGLWSELGPLDPQVLSIQAERHYFREQESALESFHAARYAQQEVVQHLDVFIKFLLQGGISGRFAVQEAVKLVEATIGKIYSNVSPFELGSSGRILEVMQKYCLEVMVRSYKDSNRRKDIAKKLVWDYPGHDFIIDYEEAKRINLNVRQANNNEQALLDELSDSLGEVYCVGMVTEEQKVQRDEHDEQAKITAQKVVPIKDEKGEDDGKESIEKR